MIDLKELSQLLHQLLDVGAFSEKGLNGLQVQTQSQVHHIALAVSANQRTFEQAHACGADTLIVHHGLYWGQPLPCTGLFGQRLGALYRYQLNLLAYHLPLDCHPQLGNNYALGRLLNLSGTPVAQAPYPGILYEASCQTTLGALTDRLKQELSAPVISYAFGPEVVQHVSWCTGAGADFLELVQTDCFITGEISERHYDMAREKGCHLVVAGHYATETTGIRLLGSWLQRALGLKVTFIDAVTPL